MKHKIKAVILGLSNSGKSTAANILLKKGLPVIEVDDMAQVKNDGIWPEDEDLLDRLFKESNDEILYKDNVVFVTSFLEIDEVKNFYKDGFTFIELHATYEELVARKIRRDGYPKDKFERFNRNYANYQFIFGKINHYISASFDTTTENPEQIAEKIYTLLNS